MHKALGTVRVNRARNDAAWPALLLALRRVGDLALDPADVLAAAVNRRMLRTATSLSQAVALDIHRRLSRPVPGH